MYHAPDFQVLDWLSDIDKGMQFIDESIQTISLQSFKWDLTLPKFLHTPNERWPAVWCINLECVMHQTTLDGGLESWLYKTVLVEPTTITAKEAVP